MLRFGRRGTFLAPLAALAVALAFGGAALAGGWATARLDGGGTPPTPNAGEKMTIGFTLLQHGETPISWEQVTLIGSNAETGDSVVAEARPDGKTGHYVVEVTFPSAGTWNWRLETQNLVMQHSTFPALSVGAGSAAAAPAGSGSAAGAGIDPVLAMAGLVLAFLAGAFVGSFRGERRAVEPTSADAQMPAGEQLATR
jgi:hypothetical protein